ncbi:NADH:ubiquinone oxidoreductase, Na(+)-translocating, A subunit [Prevotella amnii]|uniref:Na(+)-translocating NADH-quinone reductase subunit A n=1 Tax=Prevotella amnii TaxID=419005 RepID=A0A134BLK4_9BACT|nr:Na(+)-translocating NADH-quinone reductase subunit A [Prevotella amnii]KXB80823.1 NADH:ubiquinone oxidoreductase, Na(+)-translocating, A subunit [Prevotella amnii]
MANVIKLRKGLDINMKGRALLQSLSKNIDEACEYALSPDDFVGVTPKVVVKEGDHVLAGEFLFVEKKYPEIGFASPVSGVITSIVRGKRRKVLLVKVKPDKDQQYIDFGKKDISSLASEDIIKSIVDAGLFGYIQQLPYDISVENMEVPKSIFISALRDKPLQGDFEFELKGQEKEFQTGLSALAKISKVYLGLGAKQTSSALISAKDVDINIFDGPCPAGNVGVQVNHIDPVNKGEKVWTIDPTVVLFIGRLFNTGRVDLTRKIAIAGSMMKQTGYIDALVGTPIKALIDKNIETNRKARLLKGNPLTGVIANSESFVGAHTSEITAIPEGDDINEFAGWIKPRLNMFSISRSYFSWLFGKKKEYDIDARIKGSKRHIIMSGEYDKVLPMNIYSEFLIKAIIVGNIDKQEQLGIYEISPEDFALAEFVDSSKLELQKIVRTGLDILRKENA